MVKVKVGDMMCETIEKEPEKVDTHEITELSTCPVDPRFQQMNKTKWCYTMFIDFHRCTYLLGEGNEKCKLFQKCYTTLCPHEWVQTWEDQIDNGCFPRDLTKEMGR